MKAGRIKPTLTSNVPSISLDNYFEFIERTVPKEKALFKSHNTAFFCLRENFDTSTAMGELMLIQAMSFAQYERQTIVDRIKKGARARAERGLANGYVPLGFKLVEHRPNYREVAEDEKAYVEMIFRKFLELKRINHLVKYLNENGYRTKEFITKSGKKAGGNRWTLSSIHHVLTNRCYIGEREINKRHRSLNTEKLKEDELYLFVNAHWSALIPRELFYDVQSLLESNKKKARKYVHEYRLTGLIECSECGASLVGKSGTGKNSKYFYYGHKRKMITGNDRHLQRCRIENISAPMIEEAIISRLKDLSNDKELVAELAMASSAQAKSRLEHMKSLIGAKEQERRRLQVKLDNLYDSIAETDDKILRTGLGEKAKEVQDQVTQTEESLQALKVEFSNSNNVVDVSEAMEFIRIFRDKAFYKLSVGAQADILKGRVRRIVVKDHGILAVEIFGRKQEMVSPFGGNGIDGHCGAEIRSAITAEGIENSEDLENKVLKLKNPVESENCPISRRTGVRTGFKLVAGAGFEPTTFGL